jgi:hypothetical protein
MMHFPTRILITKIYIIEHKKNIGLTWRAAFDYPLTA